MQLIEPFNSQLMAALKEQRQWAERAEQGGDLATIKDAMNACRDARMRAWDLIGEGEAATRRQALQAVEQAA